jgi:Spy/CpxP family protein refolding chaperone
MPETNEANAASARPIRRRRWLWLGGGVLAGLAVLAAFAAPRAWAYRGAMGQGFGPHGGHRHGFAARMLEDPGAAKAHAGLAVEWVLRGVDGSDEQKGRARAVSDRLIDQLGPYVERHRELLREAFAAELAKPQIDRQAIERLRRQGIALADEASRTAVAAVADLAEVLTPEQRTELIEFAHRLHGEGHTH